MLCGMDWGAFRDAFRKEREERVGSRAKLVELALERSDEKLDESTVFRIETDETYMPGIDTFARLIEAMPGLSFSEFFGRIEGLPTSPAQENNRPSNLAEAPSHGHPLPSAAAITEKAVLLAVGETIADSIDRGFVRLESFLNQPRKQTATARVGAPKRSPRDRKISR